MRTFLTLVIFATALFALTSALRLGSFRLLDDFDAQTDVGALALIEPEESAIPDAQFYTEDTESDDFEVVDVAAQFTPLPTQFTPVPLPPGRHVVLGPPKYPRNIVARMSKPYCLYKEARWNATCASTCARNPKCGSYYYFEATNSGTPKLPYWFCYSVGVKLASSDFKPDVQSNFAHAFNRK